MNPAANYILEQKEPYRSILLHLQAVIEASIPNIEMKYKYKIPFFYLPEKRPFCYLNCTRGYVDLVFWNGTHLTKHIEKLVLDNRKHMKSLRYKTLEEIDEQVLLDILEESYSLRDKKYYK